LLPLREAFAVLFFVALGRLIDSHHPLEALPWILLLLFVLVIAKVVPIYYLSRLVRSQDVDGFQLAVGLGQVGEFGFVLTSIGVASRIVPGAMYTAMLVLVRITIAASTVLVRIPKQRVAALVRGKCRLYFNCQLLN
jgi:CPA2 family monovalent cation:H+ antiporter-2